MERTINKRLAEEVMRIATLPLDLEENIFAEEESNYETANPETIEELMEFSTAETFLEEQEFKTIIQDLLASVTPRESKILKLRFGIGTEKEHTLEQIASIYDVTRENIRQIEAKALRKMRHPTKSDRLKPYIGWELIADLCPNIKNYSRDMDGMFRYHEALASWKTRREIEQAKLIKIKEQLKKGMLV